MCPEGANIHSCGPSKTNGWRWETQHQETRRLFPKPWKSMTFWMHLPSFSSWRAHMGLEIVVPPGEGRHSRSRWGEVHLLSYFSKFYHPPGCLSMEPKAAQAPCLWLHSSSLRPERNIVSIYFSPLLKKYILIFCLHWGDSLYSVSFHCAEAWFTYACDFI